MTRTLQKYNSLYGWIQQPECRNKDYIENILIQHDNKLNQEIVLCQARLKDIQKLISLRSHITKEESELIIYLVSNLLNSSEVKSYSLLMRKSTCLDVCQKLPLSDSQILNLFQKNSHKAYYKYSNKKLIEILKITKDEEKEMLSIKYLTKRQQQKQESEARKVNIAKRDAKILRMARNGKSLSYISKKIGLSRTRISQILKTRRQKGLAK